LGQSVVDAAVLAETSIRDNLIAAGRISDEIRRQLILELLSMEAVPALGTRRVTFPTRAELNRIKSVRNDVRETLPALLDVSVEEVEQRLLPPLDRLQEFAAALPKSGTPQKFLAEAKNADAMGALLNWSYSVPLLKRIEAISNILESHAQKQKDLTATTDTYLKLINKFLYDSGKSIVVDHSGYLSIEIEGVGGNRPIGWLSSGEAQIFVILTHLSFSAAAQAANIFIIDEPELSLHVQWQELFVESVLAANPNIQYVMSTHSPSIILERTKACVVVNGHRAGVAK
jgi:hypothetical protein